MDTDEGHLFTLCVNTVLLVCLLVCLLFACLFCTHCSKVELNLDLDLDLSALRGPIDADPCCL